MLVLYSSKWWLTTVYDSTVNRYWPDIKASSESNQRQIDSYRYCPPHSNKSNCPLILVIKLTTYCISPSNLDSSLLLSAPFLVQTRLFSRVFVADFSPKMSYWAGNFAYPSVIYPGSEQPPCIVKTAMWSNARPIVYQVPKNISVPNIVHGWGPNSVKWDGRDQETVRTCLEQKFRATTQKLHQYSSSTVRLCPFWRGQN